MSDNVLQPDLDALHESAIDLLTYISETMAQGLELLDRHEQLIEEDRSATRQARLKVDEYHRDVKEELKKVKNAEITMTIVAPTSAGKSTILNAIAGQDLLPSSNDAMTILPTEIVFVADGASQAKLLLDETLIGYLQEAWRRSHQRIHSMGIEVVVDLAMKADFPRRDFIEGVAKTEILPIQSEVRAAENIKAALTVANNLLRLCNILGVSTEFISSLPEMPRIEVPLPSKLRSLKTFGKLVLVDTPGPNENKSVNLETVVTDRLKASSLILMVLDYTTIGQVAPAQVKKLVDQVAEFKGRDRIYFLVNKVDLRDPGNSQDLTRKQVLDLAKEKSGIEDVANRVFEVSGYEAFLATSFLSELEAGRSSSVQEMRTVDALGRCCFGKSWAKERSTVTLEDMQDAAEELWKNSGFDRFLDRAIIPLMQDLKGAKTSAIRNGLKDSSVYFHSFQSCMKERKGILDRKIGQLETEIQQIEEDLEEIQIQEIPIYGEPDEWRERSIRSSLITKIIAGEMSELIKAIKNASLVAIQYELDITWEKLLEINSISLGLDRNECVYVNMSMVREIEKFNLIAMNIACEYSTQELNRYDINKIIKKVDTDIKNYHKNIFLKAEKRLGKPFSFDLRTNERLIDTFESIIYCKPEKTYPEWTSNILKRDDYYYETKIETVTLYILYLQKTRNFFWDKPLDVKYQTIHSYIKLPDLNLSLIPHIDYDIKADTTGGIRETQGIEIAYACKGTWIGWFESKSYKSHSYYVTKEILLRAFDRLFGNYGSIHDNVVTLLGNVFYEVSTIIMEDVKTIFQEQSVFLNKYKKELKSSLKEAQAIQRQYLLLKKEYIMFLERCNLIFECLKYQEEYPRMTE